MITRSQFHQLALEANERQVNVRDDVLPVPTLGERVSLYLRAVHGDREFTEEERSNARNALLDSMAAEITAQVRPDWQSVQRKEAIRVLPIASRRTSILALTATLGLVLIVTGGTLGYRWTYWDMGDEITPPAEQARVPPPTVFRAPPPTVSPRSLSIPPSPDKATPEQHVLQIVSDRSEADVLGVFRRLQERQPTLFGQATLKRIDLGLHSYTAQVGPFASEKDAAAVCRALEAADIQCLGQPEGR
jgi:hypothetical protein